MSETDINKEIYILKTHLKHMIKTKDVSESMLRDCSDILNRIESDVIDIIHSRTIPNIEKHPFRIGNKYRIAMCTNEAFEGEVNDIIGDFLVILPSYDNYGGDVFININKITASSKKEDRERMVIKK